MLLGDIQVAGSGVGSKRVTMTIVKTLGIDFGKEAGAKRQAVVLQSNKTSLH